MIKESHNPPATLKGLWRTQKAMTDKTSQQGKRKPRKPTAPAATSRSVHLHGETKQNLV
jgi:hypothetical protein